MAVINEPKYDEDVVNLGYLRRILGLSETDGLSIIVTKNYGTAPNPPYGLNDTYMYEGKVYICIRARNVGEFNPDDWALMADNSALGDYATNGSLDNAVGALIQKIESTATGINIEVAKKMNKTDFTHANIVLAINDNSSTALINADKINLTATDILNLLANNSINLSSKNIRINSNNFNVDANGNCTANSFNSSNANITGGNVHITGANSSIWITNGSGGYAYMFPHQLDVTDGRNSFVAEPTILNIYDAQGRRQIRAELLNNMARIRTVNDNGSGYQLDSENGIGGVSDKRKKRKIKSIDNETSKNIIESLRPVTYKFKKSERMHRGFIAQEVENTLKKSGIEDQIYTIDEEGTYQLVYDEFLADLVGCNQYLIKKIEKLEKEISRIKRSK